MEENNAGVYLGKSLTVPSVQELVANNQSLNSVPSRYIRSDDTHRSSILSYDPQSTVPIIDFQNLLSGDLARSELELTNLDFACKNWGFFQLINHGVSDLVMEKVKSETYEFFKLPMEEKMKLWQNENEMEGFGQAFVFSDEQKLDWADLFFMITRPRHFRKPHLFPMLPLPFRETIDAYSAQLEDLAMKILENIGKAVEMESEEMKELFEGGMQSMRMNYYPPCPKPDQVIGLAPHSDAVGLTILLQLNQMNGLQILKNGIWVPVNPLPGAFIVNIGDILEIATNGKYRSIEHRAVVNSAKGKVVYSDILQPKFITQIGSCSELDFRANSCKIQNIACHRLLQGLIRS